MSGSILKFTDSVVTAVTMDRSAVTIRLEPALIVKSERIPGVDPSTLWRQTAELVLSGEAELEGEPAELPLTLAEGSNITVNGTTYVDHCPLPLKTSGFAEIELKAAGHPMTTARGGRIELRLIGVGKYIRHL
jgi:hypothetical protein